LTFYIFYGLNIHYLNQDFQIWIIQKIQSKFLIEIFSWARLKVEMD